MNAQPSSTPNNLVDLAPFGRWTLRSKASHSAPHLQRKPLQAIMNDLIRTSDADIVPLIERAVLCVREDMRDNPYILEAVRVLPVQGYRSAIGAFWNAVVDDLRNKIIFRSLHLFNKEVKVGREIKTYEYI